MNTNNSTYLSRICFFLYIIIASLQCFAQNTIKQLSNIDGLSNNSINCLFEDLDQNLWVGTWDGLNVYNGKEFKIYRYNPNNKSSISNNVIRQIIELDRSTLWITTDYGVNCLDKLTQTFTSYFPGTEQHIPKQEKSYLAAVTTKNELLCFVKQQGLYCFDKQKQNFVGLTVPFAQENIKTFNIDENDNAFFLFDNGKVQQYKIQHNKDSIHLLFINEISSKSPVNQIFISNNNLILNYSDSLKILSNSNNSSWVVAIDPHKTISQVIDHKGNLLIGYYEGGCLQYNKTDKTLLPLEHWHANVALFSLFSGSQNILWIGTDGQGLYKIYKHNVPFKTVLTAHAVRSFCEIKTDQILIGTKGDGVKLFNKKSTELSDLFNTDNGLISNSVYAIRKNKSGDVFIGTEGVGMNVLYQRNNQLKKLEINATYPQFKAVYCMLFTHNDSLLWLGTSGYGLIKISLNKIKDTYVVTNMEQYLSTGRPGSLNNNVIYDISATDIKNELWLGTRGGGISKFNMDTKVFEPLDSSIKLMSYDIIALMNNSSGLWVGSSYGLNNLSMHSRPIQIKEFTSNDGLSNNTIHGILEDNDRSIWVSTNQGISCIKHLSKIINNYSLKDGLQNNEFSDGAYFKDQSGTLFFGGVSGFNYFRPEEIKLRDFDPNIELSNVRIFNSSQNINERIKDNVLNLSYHEAYVSFTVIARDFINNENCEYIYRLLNFSDEWIHNVNSNSISLTRLPPGSYQLEVKCTNGDRVWGSKVYQLQIKVASPWWFSFWAFLAYFLLVGGIIYISYWVIRNRIRLNKQILLEHIEKQNQQKIYDTRLDFFTNIAHEFFTPLTLIYGPAQHLLERIELDTYTKRYIQMIKNNADRMRKLINELMEFRKIELGHTPIQLEDIDLNFFINYISDNYTEIAHERKIDFKINTKALSYIISDRNALEKIIFNLISNAFKYTPDNGYVHINAWQDTKFYLSIRNSGKGLSTQQMSEMFDQFKIFDRSKLQKSTSTGLGLGLSKSLTEMLSGNITVSSQLEEYVEFSLEIPSLLHNSLDQIKAQADPINSTFTSQSVANRSNISILIVEDEKNIRELLKDILLGYNITEAENGIEALVLIKKNIPNIIISDILMPNMDGIKLIDLLKQDPETTHIPIINISAKTAVEDHINAYAHGADLYIEKPFHPCQVLIAVENLIKKHSILKAYYNSSRSVITVKDGSTIHQDDERFLRKIVSYIERNIDDELLDPNSLAESLGLSKGTLYRKLKEVAGKTPSEFVRSVRLLHASKLLTTTKMTVSEVMYQSGFNNKSYFYREFGKTFGSSPKEYRNSKFIDPLD